MQSNGIEESGTQLHSRIEEMFNSNDREMVKLAQKMCHHHRISYYIMYRKMSAYRSFPVRGEVLIYSLVPLAIDWPESTIKRISDMMYPRRVAHIKLRK